MGKRPDPFEILIGLRDMLAEGEPLPRSTTQQRYEQTRRAFEGHARRRSAGEVVASALLPPIPEVPATELAGLGREIPALWSNDEARIPLELVNRRSREMRIVPRIAVDEHVTATLRPDEPVGPGARVEVEILLCAADGIPEKPLLLELWDGREVCARLHVASARTAQATPVTIPLCEGDEAVLSALRGLQRLILDHPIAARRIFGALVAEGREFAKTERGADWSARLRDSDLLRQMRLVVQMTSLSMLEHADEPDVLPSAYLEALFAASTSEESDELLNRLFGEDAG